jgi:pseudouridine-5'-phosphate glycosidase
MSLRWQVAPAVSAALGAGRPVVALETTLVTHGLPPDVGVQTALDLERIVVDAGATPATIGVLSGKVLVGMSAAELAQLAATPNVAKLNLSNLGPLIAAGASGSTTVAATLCLAHRAGIRVFATGGIGGVHRQAETTGDVSADLTALARYPLAVVCAGAKAVLDLPRTLELLETLGVPVIGYGTDALPAFYRRSSGLPLDRRCDDVATLAACMQTHWALGMTTGVLVGNPIPADAELPSALYEKGLADALAAAEREGVTGRDVTPFLLERLRATTAGASVEANVALLRNNARVAAELSVSLA